VFKTKADITTKIHLIISVCIVIPVAFSYGFYPDLQFELFPKTIDEHNFYKAIMGLYLGFSAFWIWGVLNSNFLKTALVTHCIFMLGLGSGRVLSILIDGLPTFGYIFGTVAELFLGVYGLWVIKRFHNLKQLKKQ
jgi:hypothetical protein